MPDTGQEARATPLAVWMQACRVKSLAISSIGVLVGSTVAFDAGYFDWLRLLLAWLGSVAIQAGTNLTNVSYNYKGGTGPGGLQADPRGSSAVVRFGLLTPEVVRRGGFLCFAVGIFCGLALTWLCGPVILWIGVPAVIAGYSYAGPPLRLGYLALGVVTVFVFMGPVMVCGAYYVMALHFSPSALAASFVIGLLAAGIMHTNDIRDYENDVIHRKRTLATLLGRRGASYAQAFMNAAAYGITIAAVGAGLLPWLVLLVLLTIPRAVSQTRMVFEETAAEKLNTAWFRGVQLHMEFGVLMIAGLLLATLLGK